MKKQILLIFAFLINAYETCAKVKLYITNGIDRDIKVTIDTPKKEEIIKPNEEKLFESGTCINGVTIFAVDSVVYTTNKKKVRDIYPFTTQFALCTKEHWRIVKESKETKVTFSNARYSVLYWEDKHKKTKKK